MKKEEEKVSWNGITSVSRLEEENEEKLLEGICKEYGSTAGAAACNLSCNRSLMLIICSPSGQPLDVSWFWEESSVQNIAVKCSILIILNI